MHAPGLLLATGLLGGSVVAVGSQVSGWVYKLINPYLGRLAPEDRAKVIAGMAMLPWMLAMLVILLAFLPSFVTIPGLIEDHCLPHEHHPHLCLVHGCWMPSGHLWGGVGLLYFSGATLWIRLVRKVFVAQRTVLTLIRVSRREGGLRVLPSQRPMAFTAGLLNPQTVISDAVLTGLSPEDLDVVLRHEEAHVERKDILWRVALEALAFAMPKTCRALLLEEFSLACEEACDRRAARGHVTPDRVAEVLLRMSRLGCVQPQGVAGATGSHLARRVKALLGEPYPPRPKWMKALWLSPALLLLADPVHHAAESLLGWFLS